MGEGARLTGREGCCWPGSPQRKAGAMARALMFRAGTVGMICAAYEVELTRGTETTEGSIRPVRDCTNLATELVRGTGLCSDCAEALSQSSNVSVARVIRRPELN
jgi:hypothetical protein